jgi:hypothetical protein
MSRTANLQFTMFTEATARAYLASCKPSKNYTSENHGDRVAAQRALMPVTTPEERAAAQSCSCRWCEQRRARVEVPA